MANTKKWIFYAAAALLVLPTAAQVTDRERPADWANLVKGGRYMDRFRPMPKGKLSADVWGARDVIPRYVDNGIELPGISFWGGNVLKGKDGTYNLFVCGWPESAPKGHMEWPNSTVYRAQSKNLYGPYTLCDTIGKGHNPEAFMLDDGRIVVYVIGAYYIADSMEGPWEQRQFTFNTRGRRIIEGLSNLTFARRQDGSRLMVCRGGGVWISRSGVSPYEQITEQRIYPPVEGEFEDPVVWKDSLQYHLIVNDWKGRIAFYERSLDGVHWVTEQGEAYVPGISRHKDGRVEKWYKYERAKVYQDERGRPQSMNFAVIDTIKWNDLGNDNHSSKNIFIPLTKDMLADVLNTQPIDAATRTIEVRIRGEKGFSPAKELDVASLRIGSYTEVNFGRGSKPVSWKKSGKDLLVTFDGTGSGITPTEFAPKIIGKNKRGELAIGYARLPYVNYTPPVLSALCPVYDEGSQVWNMEIQNFGLSASEEARVTLTYDDTKVAETTVRPLKPYEKTVLSFKAGQTALKNDGKTVVTIRYDERRESQNRF